MEARPAAGLRWSWRRVRPDGTEQPLPASQVVSEGAASWLQLTPSSLDDYGALLCRAENEVGLQQRPCQVSLVPAGPPDAPLNCTTSPASGEGLIVECEEGFDGGLPTTFLLQAWLDGKTKQNYTR